jgi:hypothetical protein
MCHRCEELDAEIARWRRLASEVNDITALGLIEYEIKAANKEKAALHPERPSGRRL